MDTQGYLRTMQMTAYAAWLDGLVAEMDTYGVAVEKLKNTANVPRTEGRKSD